MISFREWLNEREGVETEYQKFFKKKLEKYGVDSPAELSGEDKKKFFDEIGAEWEAENEEPEENDNINESKDLNYGYVIQFIVENLKDPKSKEAQDVIVYLGKNLK